jgi:uridine kinase
VTSDHSQDRAANNRFFDAQAAEIVHNYGRGRAVVAVDGAVGASDFARELVTALDRAGHTSIFASIEDFVQPTAPGESTEQTSSDYYARRYDYATFRRELVAPFRRTTSPDAILVIAGPFLARRELRGIFNYTIFLETPERPQNAALSEALDRYAADAEPRFTATAIVDVTDPVRPRRVFADSC